MHGHGDCPGCIQPLVGHDADCEVMSEKAPHSRPTWSLDGNCMRHEVYRCATCLQSPCLTQPSSPGAPQIPPEPQDTGKSAATRIRERIAEKRSLYEHYHQHTKRMWEEHDAHGGWDSFINGSEVSNRIDELEWCLAVIEGREP